MSMHADHMTGQFFNMEDNTNENLGDEDDAQGERTNMRTCSLAQIKMF